MRNNQIQKTLVESVDLSLRADSFTRAFSIMRRPSESKKAGICVILIDDHPSNHRIFSFLKDHLKKLPRAKESIKCAFDPKCVISDYFDELDRLKLSYLVFMARHGAHTVRITFLRDNIVDETFCAELTKLGCPASLGEAGACDE